MPKQDKKERKPSIWTRLFSGWSKSDHGENAQIDLMPSGVVSDFTETLSADQSGATTVTGAQDGNQAIHTLPVHRVAKYAVFDTMATDPTIDSAIKMHCAHALSANPETGKILTIESRNEKEDAITLDLRNALESVLNKSAHQWAYMAFKYGISFQRIYGEEKLGIRHIRNDYYTHPAFTKIYERGNGIAGFTSAYQQQSLGRLRMLDPWTFTFMRIPIWTVDKTAEPVNLSGKIFDIASEDFENEGLIEAQNYGMSLLETAYSPWIDLLEAILSMNMSRKNAARLERMIAMHVGRLNPRKAAEYLNTVANQLLNANKANARDSLRRGYVQSVVNHLIPVFGEGGKGQLEMSTIEPNPNIDAISDIMFHVERLGSALGVDPALLGFSSSVSGSLGEGPWFQTSLTAAIKSMLLRHAAQECFERICDIHVAWKFGKVFTETDRPWNIKFYSVSTALESEDQRNKETRINFGQALATLITTFDPEMSGLDKEAFANFLFTDLLKVDEDKFRGMFPKWKAEKAQAQAQAFGQENTEGAEQITESAPSDKLRTTVYEIIRDFYRK